MDGSVRQTSFELTKPMALLADYKHDIFVSYAHNDNQPLVSGTDGWVRTLVNQLRVRSYFIRRSRYRQFIVGSFVGCCQERLHF